MSCLSEKSEIIIFWKLLQLMAQSCLKNSTKELMKLSIRGQGHSLTLVKGHSDFKVKTCFSQKQLGDLKPKLI